MAKMIGMSEREYAAHIGLARGSVREAKKTFRLVLYPDGSINAEASDIAYASLTDPLKAKAKALADRAFADGPDPAAFLEARTENEQLKARRNEMLLAKDRGELIDKGSAERLVFQLARRARDAWVTWPARVAALAAAEIAAEVEHATGQKVPVDPGAVQRILESHVRMHLESISDPSIRLG